MGWVRIVWFYHEGWLSMGMHGPKITSASMAWLTNSLRWSQLDLMFCIEYAGQHANMLSERSSIMRTKVFDP